MFPGGKPEALINPDVGAAASSDSTHEELNDRRAEGPPFPEDCPGRLDWVLRAGERHTKGK